jgi:hypothetical protein
MIHELVALTSGLHKYLEAVLCFAVLCDLCICTVGLPSISRRVCPCRMRTASISTASGCYSIAVSASSLLVTRVFMDSCTLLFGLCLRFSNVVSVWIVFFGQLLSYSR